MINPGKRPRVLLLGPDKYVVRACVNLGVEAVVVCSSAAWDKGMMQIPDVLRMLRVENQTSPEEIIAALHREGLDAYAFDAIQTTDEWGIVVAGLLAGHLGCRGIDPVTAVRFRDKYLQKRIVSDAGMKTARIEVITDIFDVSGYTELPWDRAVLKPISGAAAARTSVLSSIEDLRALSRSYREEGCAQRIFVLEEFSAGTEWMADGAVLDEELIFFSLGRYSEPCIAALDAERTIWTRRIDTASEQWAYELAQPFIEKAIRALGLRDGVFHMEMFFDPASGELTFGECAARRGGGLLTEEIMAKSGVDMGELALCCALGAPPDLKVTQRPETIGSTFLTVPAGIMLSCPSNAQILERPLVEYAWIEKADGTRFSSRAHNTVDNVVGQVLLAAESEAHLVENLAAVRSWFSRESVVLPDVRTQRDLRHWRAGTQPGAVSGEDLWFGSWKSSSGAMTGAGR